VICSQNNYWLWSIPVIKGKEIMVAYGGQKEDFEKAFYEVIDTGLRNESKFGYQGHLPIYICKKPKVNLIELWKTEKNYR
jgi:hypothetical protein